MLGCVDTLLPTSAAAKGLPQARSQGLIEFVSGNLLFVLCHEMAHAAMTEDTGHNAHQYHGGPKAND